jgi:hypothetical protein
VDATLGLMSQTAVDDAIDAAPDTTDNATDEDAVVARLGAVVRDAGETLAEGRRLIRLTIDSPDRQGSEAAPRRGYRRMAWIDRAVEPLRDRLGPDRLGRLVAALSVVVGWESLIVLGDVAGLGPDDRRDVALWSARALVHAALIDAAAGDEPSP